MITKLTEDQKGDVKGGSWILDDEGPCEKACNLFCVDPTKSNYKYAQGQPQYRV